MVPQAEIASLQSQLSQVQEANSAARQKLAVRRVIRACEGLLEANKAAPNRFEVLHVLFRAQQEQIKLDNSEVNRQAFLETCARLAAAPDEYASLRLDADLLLSQTALAQQGASPNARAEALKPLVQRYQDTDVQAKVIRIVMLMAIEFGDAGLIQFLTDTIAERMPGNMEMINFQRDHLAGQVFGAPFVGQFQCSDGKTYRFPMDAMGKTTALYFWSKEDDGLEELKALAEGWDKVKADPEMNAAIRYQFISFNLDGLPDAGEGLLREAGLDWPAMHLPGGVESDIYKTYVRDTPKLLTMTPTGYTAMVMSGATRVGPDRGWERSLQSGLARSWAKPAYSSQIQSLLVGDFLVVDAAGVFDPAAPPELKAAQLSLADASKKLSRNAGSVPEEKLRAIQACFVKPPMRYRLTLDEMKANYEKAELLCRQAIEQHPDANDLWIVRNRQIVALMGLYKAQGKREIYEAAAQASQRMLESDFPQGADIVARFCLARQAIRQTESDPVEVIDRFVQDSRSAYSDAAGSLLALEIADRKLHEHYRRSSLDKHADTPVLWNATSFFMDRYQRYWLYQPPFTAGWTYGRRMGHFLSIGTHEDAQRTLQLELKTLEGESVRVSELAQGKWAVIEFRPDAQSNPHLNRNGTFVDQRPQDDVKLITVVLDDNADQVRAALAANKNKDVFPTLLLPGGMSHPIVQQLGILDEKAKPNIALVRPDGSIAVFLSGLTMNAQNGNAIQNIIEHHDEQLVDEALARGDLEEAKRLAFAYAPVEQVKPEGAPKNWKPKALTVPHLRARAKVYMAMKDWKAAYADAQWVYLEVKKKAGWLSMRTRELDEMEAMKALIESQLNQTSSLE